MTGAVAFEVYVKRWKFKGLLPAFAKALQPKYVYPSRVIVPQGKRWGDLFRSARE